MLRFLIFTLGFLSVYGYFTSPGQCPYSVPKLEDFRLQDFLGTWYQAYHYSSDGQELNNCSKVEVTTKGGLVSFNVSRIDLGLFHRYSVANVQSSSGSENVLKLEFKYDNAPRRLKSRRYDFHIVATNYKYYATAYTCQYSPLIDKHFIYLWVLSRNPILNDVSKELALDPFPQNVKDKLIKDDNSKCSPKYYDDIASEPRTFRYPVPV